MGLIAPSLSLAAHFPERLVRSISNFEYAFGVTIKVAPHVYLKDPSPQERALDLNRFIDDPQIKAIFTTVGGFNSSSMLPYIDFSRADEVSKILCGYSDTTALLVPFSSLKSWTCLYGPALLPQFGEYPAVLGFTIEAARTAFSAASWTMPMPACVTTEFLDWAGSEWLSRPRKLVDYTGMRAVRTGRGNGTLFGGNLETLNFLVGSPWWTPPPDPIFFVEATEDEATPARLERSLMHFVNVGLADRIQGLMLGYCAHSEPESSEVREMLLRVFRAHDFPILLNAPFGHADPMITLPLMRKATITAPEPHHAKLEIDPPTKRAAKE